MTQFHAEVEGEQRHRHAAAVAADTQVTQHGREAEAVDESKCEREHPTIFWIAAPQQVFHADINDGCGDEWLGVFGGQSEYVECRDGQRDGMGERERGDDRECRLERARDDQQPEQKQQMIVARADVFDAELEKIYERARGGFGWGSLARGFKLD